MTPKLLQGYGANARNLSIAPNVMYKIAYPAGYLGLKQGHNLGIPALKQLLGQIADPVAILSSKDERLKDSSLIILTEWDNQNGEKVIIPIHLDKQGAISLENRVASAYGKDNIQSLLGENNENIIYTKNKEDINQLLSSRLQLPAAMADDVFNSSIPQNSENSNNNILGNGEISSLPQSAVVNETIPQSLAATAPFTQGGQNLGGGSRQGKLGSAKAVADILSSAYGVKFAEYSAKDGLNGYYDPETRVIYVNQMSDEPVLATISHELIHDLKVNDAAAFSLLRKVVNSDMNLERFNQYRSELLAAYDAIGKDYSGMTKAELDECVLEEAMADLCSEVMRDPSTITRIAKADRNLAQKIMDKIDEIIDRICKAFSEYFGGETAEIRNIVNHFEEVQSVYQSVLENSAKRGPQSEGVSGEVKGSIETLPDGKRYVQADRKVIYSNDPSKWGDEVENYINEKIRNHQDIEIPTQDGDILKITSDTAWKLGDRTGKTDEQFARKMDAATHIDELATISKYERNKPDKEQKHKNKRFYADSFDYRNAFFRDFDGEYYFLSISVGVDESGKTVYSIGNIQKRRFPAVNGSSGKTGAQTGQPSSNSIPQSGSTVNTSIRSEQQKDTSFDKPMSVSRKQRATEAIAKYKETN